MQCIQYFIPRMWRRFNLDLKSCLDHYFISKIWSKIPRGTYMTYWYSQTKLCVLANENWCWKYQLGERKIDFLRKKDLVLRGTQYFGERSWKIGEPDQCFLRECKFCESWSRIFLLILCFVHHLVLLGAKDN